MQLLEAADRFAAGIRAGRYEQRLSLRRLADRSGVSAPMISQVERGESVPTLPVAERIAAALGRPLEELLRDAGRSATSQQSPGTTRLGRTQ